MNKPKPSLLERAADIYDFASGLPVAPVSEPPPAARPRAVAAVAAEPRVEPLPRPSAKVARPTQAPLHRQRVEIDPVLLASEHLLVPDAPGNGLAEEMRLIKRRLLAGVDARVGQGDDHARLVLIASGQPGEGKTFMALNLALSIATEADRRVLLIDGDNAKPEALARLGIEAPGEGFADALADARIDAEQLVTDTDIPGLSLLSAGRRERNIPELLASDRAREVLDRLVAADPRRIILIDSSPALVASATVALAQHVGQALVVVRADVTSEADLKATLDLLSVCDHLSLALNSAAFQVGRRRYGKYEDYR